MFGGKVKILKSENEFLRQENKELRIQLIALCGKSNEYYNAKNASQKQKTSNDVMDNIIKHKPKNAKEEQLQKDALLIAKGVFGGQCI